MSTYHGHPNGMGRRFALVCSRFNDLIVSRLEYGARDALVRHGVDDDAIDTVWVPGAWEIPMAAKALADTGRYDAIVGLGAVMRGATYHFEVISNQSAAGLARLALDSDIVRHQRHHHGSTRWTRHSSGRAARPATRVPTPALAALETLDVIQRINGDVL